MPLDARDTAAVLELFLQLQPLAQQAYLKYILSRTIPRWQDDMAGLAMGVSITSALPVYERAYVLDWCNQLLPGAQEEYSEYILSRTLYSWQPDMVALMGTDVLPSTAWGRAVIAAGGTVSDAQRTRVGNLVVSLQAQGIWTKLDRLWLYAAENTQQALVDVVARTQATVIGAPGFITMRGFKGDAAAASINTNFNPTIGTNKFVRDNASHGGWFSAGEATGSAFDFGNNQSLNVCSIVGNFGGANKKWGTNGSTQTNYADANVKIGMNMAQRTAAGASALWVNGVSVATDTFASVAVSNATFRALAAPNATLFGNARVAMQFVADSLLGKELAFYTAMNAYMVQTDALTDPDAVLWAATAGVVPSGPRLELISDFIKAEKAAGTWALTDDYLLLWGETAAQSLVSLKQRRTATVTAAPVFTIDRGYAFNGTTQFINTGFIPATHGVAMTAANSRTAVYTRTNQASAGYACGANSGGNIIMALRPQFGAVADGHANSAAGSFTNADARGLISTSRNGALAADCNAWKNGVALTRTVTPAGVGATLPTHAMYIGASDNSGAAGSFLAASVGALIVGAALTTPQELAQYTNLQALATALGAQV